MTCKALFIPSTCSKLPSTAIQNAVSLSHVIIDKNNAFYSTDGTIIYNIDHSIILMCVGCATNVNVNESAQIIEKMAFTQTHIASIDLSNTSIIKISDNAFTYANNLEYIKFPQSLQEICNYVFMECHKLITVEFISGERNLSIGFQAFNNCFNLISISFPRNIMDIKREAFLNCRLLHISFEETSSLTRISQSAFSNQDISVLTLPDSLIMLDEYSFSKCNKLETVIFGRHLTTIGSYAFNGCSSLKNIEFPADCQIRIILSSSFSECTSLEKFIIPSSLEVIDVSVFEGCTNMTSILVENNNYFQSVDGILYNSNCPKLIICPNGKQFANIDYRTNDIGNNAFYRCVKLQKIVFNKDENGYTSLELIRKNTFAGCSALSYVVFPISLKIIEENAFYHCSGLCSLIFDLDGVLESIGSKTFQNCVQLTEIILPRNGLLKSLNESLFEGCKKLQYVFIPKSITSLLPNRFKECSMLSSIQFDADSQLLLIGNSAFQDCSNLTSIDLPSAQLRSIGDSAFIGTNLENIIISKSVELINKQCFKGLKTLTKIRIEDGANLHIGSSAFEGCGIHSIKLPNTLQSIDEKAFASCPMLRYVFYCGDKQFNTINVFQNCISSLSINVLSSYQYDSFCGVPVSRSMAENCIFRHTLEHNHISDHFNKFINIIFM